MAISDAVAGAADRLVRTLFKPSVVLYIHGAVPKVADPRVQAVHFEVDSLVRTLRELAENFTFRPLTGLAADDGADGRPGGKPPIFLTSDDGYEDNLTVLLPLLQEMRIPLTLFVSTHHVETGERFPTYVLRCFCYYAEKGVYRLPHVAGEIVVDRDGSSAHWQAHISKVLKRAPLTAVREIVAAAKDALGPARMCELDEKFASDKPMTWPQVDEMRKGGAIIGAHCQYHAVLHASERPETVHEQVSGAKRIVAEKIGACDLFSYPSGSAGAIGPAALREVKAAGYKMAFTTLEGTVGRSLDGHLMPRLHLSPRGRRNVARVHLAWRANRTLRRWQRGLLAEMKNAAASPPP